MKKFLGILIMAALLMGMIPSAFAVPYTDYPWIYEDFERDDPIEAECSNASIEHIMGGVAETQGAARIKVNKDYGTAKFPFRIKNGVTYNVSAWIKMNGDVPSNNSLHFIFYMHQRLGDGSPAEKASCFKDVVVGNVEYSTDEYVYVATTFKYDGKGRLNGADVDTCDGHATVELRVGDGKLSTTNGSVIDYTLDDLIVEPVMTEQDAPVEDTSVGFKNGNFESGFDGSVWSTSNCKVSVVDGANNTNKGVMITSTGNYGQIKQRAPMQFNKAYRISLYAKAGDGATVGKELRLIIDRKDGKTDDAIITNYEYLPSSSLQSSMPSIVLTDEWQKIEMIYKNSMVTFEKNEPYIYPRVGSGTELECYCLDELEIEEIPAIVYNGDFSLGKTGWKSDGVSATVSDDIPDGAAAQSMKITETSNQGSFSQGINVQPGRSYIISFDAKGESWNEAVDEIELYPVLDRYVSNSLDKELYENLTTDDGAPAILTKDWQHYEFTYDCKETADKYRVPLFYLKTGNGKKKSTYYLANVEIIDITESDEAPDDDPVEQTGIIELMTEGRTIEKMPVTFTYGISGATDPDGIVKIMKTYKDRYVSVGSARLDGSPVEYTIRAEDVGSSLKFVVVLVADEMPVDVRSISTGELTYALNLKPKFTSAIAAADISARCDIKNDEGDIDIVAVLMLFDENNAVTAVSEETVHSEMGGSDTIVISIPKTPETKSARLFIWEGRSAADTTMNSLIGNILLR